MSATDPTDSAQVRGVFDPMHESELLFRSLTGGIRRATDVAIESRSPRDWRNGSRLAGRAARSSESKRAGSNGLRLSPSATPWSAAPAYRTFAGISWRGKRASARVELQSSRTAPVRFVRPPDGPDSQWLRAVGDGDKRKALPYAQLLSEVRPRIAASVRNQQPRGKLRTAVTAAPPHGRAAVPTNLASGLRHRCARPRLIPKPRTMPLPSLRHGRSPARAHRRFGRSRRPLV